MCRMYPFRIKVRENWVVILFLNQSLENIIAYILFLRKSHVKEAAEKFS